MREIKFRGMSEITGHEWVYGNLHIDYKSGDMWVGKEAPYEPIIRETVGQYTGLKDCNENEIYEGDIVVCDEDYYDEPKKGVVVYDTLYGCFVRLDNMAGSLAFADCDNDHGMLFDVRVIGNIHEKVSV